ncbi:helix-turn-helix transcriptional regulator [Mycolicibacterium duvalii]|uniref:LuxR family transcriptional regulator n=1 Tax=Mycolicibacterium duvalii TaxID=39688 RepID=A0A7I7K6P1_9MYCO|nr:LuxR family transcriptional regulator [Mycolicibacterium duvalii]MCV7368959.1 AAA family ATPase [Mycolicibacterium duvalii]PEG44442.1 helix-turn-helix transcriptional regulator [Mycolicibacterium duvalii]BBX19141.1 LuxR family transcriptional regulator [Mycolicibacterium duvalii]
MSPARAPFVGRAREITELGRRVATTSTDGIDVVAVTGPAGIGKTTLLRRIATEFDNALWASATAWETPLAGGVMSQLLQGPAPADPVAAAEELARVLAAEFPTVLVVDDAEDADPLSLQALSTLTRHHRRIPALIVVSVVGEMPSEIGDLVARTFELPGLRPGEVAELASARGHILHPATAARLTRHTDGNPGHVLALLDELAPETWSRLDAPLPAPRRITEQVDAALDRAGPHGQALCVALAVLDDDATLADAAALAVLDDPLTALESATREGLVGPGDPGAPRLRDNLTSAAVLDIAGPRAVADAHRRAADLVADPARRLRHRVAATPVPDEALADEVDTLARSCGAEGAWAQAASLFRDASRLTADPLARDERLTRSVDALVAAGDCLGAAAYVPAIESLRETPLRNAVLAYLAILRGRSTEAEMRLARAWDIVNTDRNPADAAFIAQRHVLHTLVRCEGEQLVHWADRALGLADEDSPAAIEAAAVRGLGLLAAGHPRRAAAAYDDLSNRVRHGAQAQRVVMGRGWVQLVRDDVDGARASLESAVAAAALGGSTRITLWALAWLARVRFAAGDWDDALASVAHGRRLAAESGIVLVTPLLEWTAGQIAALRGDWAGAEAAVRAASSAPGEYAMMRIPTLLLRGQIAEAQADYAAVRRIVTPLRGMARGTSLQEPGYWPWPDLLANAMVLDGDLDGADEFLRPHEQRARSRGHRSAAARLAYARGRLLGAQGDINAARRAFDEALDRLDGLPLRYDLARINFAYGQTLRRAGKRRAADAVISAARELYLALGADTYVARCDRELKAGGLHPQREGTVELTPQEEAVSNLVAQGRSNREVAAELYVSQKTVQYHLTRIYAKLGVRSRSELAALRR